MATKWKDQVATLTGAVERFESGRLPRVTILVGAARGRDRTQFDPAQSSLLVEVARQRVKAEGKLDWTEHDPSSSSFSLDELVADLTSSSLFGEPRFVYVPDAEPVCKFEARKRGQRTPFETAMQRLLDDEDRGHRVLVVLPMSSAESVLARDAKARQGTLIELRPLYANPPPWDPDPLNTELARFVLWRAKVRGLNLDPRAVPHLVERIGSDLSRYDQELAKLEVKVGRGGKVRREDVAQDVASSSFEADAFDFADRVMRADLESALRFLRSIEVRGARKGTGASEGLSALAPMLGSILVREARKLLAAMELREEGRPLNAVAGILGVPDVKVARAAFENRMRARDRTSTLALLEHLKALELDLRWHSVPEEIAFERFVLRTCKRKR